MGLCWPLQMPPTPKAVLISLADNANDQGYCWPSISKISERTCFSKRAVIDAIAWLELHGILAADRTNGRHTTYVITPADFVSQVQDTHRCGKSTGAHAASEPVHLPHQPVQQAHQPVREMHTNHQEPSLTVKKSNRQKDARAIRIDMPEWLSPDSWNDWVEHRKSMRKPLTQRAAELSIRELASLQAQGFDPAKIINTSILNGWQGLFAPKPSMSVRSGPGVTTQGNRQQQLEDRNRRVADAWLNGDSTATRRPL